MSNPTRTPQDTPHLNPTITFWPLVLLGLAYITPTIALDLFGTFSRASNGTLTTSYVLTTVVLLFTALSYSKMSRRYPAAGSAYTYTRRAIDSRIGFLVGWLTLLDYLFLPMVVWLISVVYLSEQFPGVPKWAFLVPLIALTTLINVLGITVARLANVLLISYQLLVLALFAFFSIRHLIGEGGVGAVVSTGPFWNSGSTVAAVSAGAALTAYSFIGFDAVSTFAEDTVQAKKVIPRAIITTLLIAGLIFVIVSYISQVLHPGGDFHHADTASLDLAKKVGGEFLRSLVLAEVIIGGVSAGIPIQASGARLLFAMGRDGVLPKRFFGRLSRKFGTPANNILLMAAVGLLALGMSLSTSTSFINFGAFTAFAFVNISVITLWWRERRTKRKGILGWIIFPSIGLAGVVWLMTSLDSHALKLGAIWLLVGIGWLTYLTKLFRREPPEIRLDEADQETETRKSKNTQEATP
ncbi:APC family permease [Sciscionella marina]|uniref:APC family permease n=1 Tax=Sciscionella marina TaxID=508770 RepID=UPI00035E009C|nr:APC family permease [Sciscionella marina]